ncbi:hypothetical protein K504DRAFT_170324 [Pleomassaria siparia CBS 279.74]|uniref:Uncharacterized protein n=1 Tax=Pleomassaria siparia CBS 279.74 TaxID=1314801 RepID=A0A6G1JU93_9PLEO|nr:hypothetical protein K504DRAFT_170324 [Pleomassaria siparia CBS 279.74]
MAGHFHRRIPHRPGRGEVGARPFSLWLSRTESLRRRIYVVAIVNKQSSKDQCREPFCTESIHLKTYLTQIYLQMWSFKKTKDKTSGIYSETEMLKMIVGTSSGQSRNKAPIARQLDEAKEALMRLKHLMGARQYMRSPTIHAIFKVQKTRMGDTLDAIDRTLPKYPRMDPANPKRFLPWQCQGLKAYWDEYMDERFKIANKRTNKDMKEYLALLKKHWHVAPLPASIPGASSSRSASPASPDPKRKDISDLVDKLERAWQEEERIQWIKPW